MPFDFVMGRDLIRDAYKRGMTVSAFLEKLDPSSKYPMHERDGDAFQRQLMRYDIRTASDPQSGILAHNVERFFQDDADYPGEQRAALFPEWLSRQYRRFSQVNPGRRPTPTMVSDRDGITPPNVRFPLQDVPLNFTLYPPTAFDQLRYQQLAPSALDVLVARTRYISAETFVALYLTDSTANAAASMVRVEEFATIPTVRFDSAEQTMRVRKYGRRLQTSYEQIRRMNLDMVSWAVMYIAQKAALDKEKTAVDVILNGDGNSGTAATSTNGSTLDGAAAGKLTLLMWLAWRYLWTRPYIATVAVAPSASLVTALLLQAAAANIAPQMLMANSVPNAMDMTLFRNEYAGMTFVDNTAVSANTILALDSRWALEMVSETGADIVETDRIISAQFSEIVMTESVGFCIATKGQNRVLAYTA